jgi:hypothetical protein
MSSAKRNPAAGHSGGAQNAVQPARANSPENKPSPLLFQSAYAAQCFGLSSVLLGKLSRPDETSTIVAYGAEPRFLAIAGAALLKYCNVAMVECRSKRELEWHQHAKRHLDPDCIVPCVDRSDGRTQ